MAKKKSPGGRHTTPRVNVSVPEPWHAVARRLAARRKQSVLWLLIDLLREAAEREGATDLPTPPWEDDASGG